MVDDVVGAGAEAPVGGGGVLQADGDHVDVHGQVQAGVVLDDAAATGAQHAKGAAVVDEEAQLVGVLQLYLITVVVVVVVVVVIS